MATRKNQGAGLAERHAAGEISLTELNEQAAAAAVAEQTDTKPAAKPAAEPKPS